MLTKEFAKNVQARKQELFLLIIFSKRVLYFRYKNYCICRKAVFLILAKYYLLLKYLFLE